MIYLTGDTHGDFSRIERFCEERHPSREDVLVILGDAAFNYYGDERDRQAKEAMSRLPLTLFCLHGNHEMRPGTIPSYHIREWNGGRVYVEDDYPSLLFAIDGEVYQLGGHQTVVIGGAYSVDKEARLASGRPWWADEQPSAEIKAAVERSLSARGWKVDVVFSHTTPLKYEPPEALSPWIDQSKVDKTTEAWLDTIEERLDYRHWFADHYHIEKEIDRLSILFGSIREFTV